VTGHVRLVRVNLQCNNRRASGLLEPTVKRERALMRGFQDIVQRARLVSDDVSLIVKPVGSVK
jgi:hypothetical protein